MNGGRKSSTLYQIGFALGYLYHEVKQELNNITAASGGAISAHELATKLAILLSTEARGTVLGAPDHVSSLRRAPAKASEALEPLEVARRAHRLRTSGIKRYWAKMTKEERRQEMRRRGMVGKKKRLLKAA